MNKQNIAKIFWAFSLILFLVRDPGRAQAQQTINVTLSTTATEPLHGPFFVTTQFSEPVTTFTTQHLALTNATAEIRALTVQNTIAAGYDHGVAVKNNGTVVTWGSNNWYGQLNMPTGLSNVVAVSAGRYFSVALKKDGTVVAWGNNDSAQCKVPTGLSHVVAIAAGDFHTLALKDDGTVVAWGSNYAGSCEVPPGLHDVIAVGAGSNYSLALKADGTLTVWGKYLVLAGWFPYTVPIWLRDVVAISIGSGSNLALRADGTVADWGAIWDHPDYIGLPAGLTDVVKIANSASHSLAQKANGQVIAWMSINYNTTYDSCINVPAGLTGVVGIAAGGGQSLAVKSDGTIVAWPDRYAKYAITGIRAMLPRISRCAVMVKPQERGTVSVQVPGGVLTSGGGGSNYESNTLQLSYDGPKPAIRSWDLYTGE